MRFFVIVSIDWTDNAEKDREYFTVAPEVLESLDQTEGDEQGEYSYLEGEWEVDEEGGWGDQHHIKYAGELSRTQFDILCENLGLRADTIETMGSLTGMGILPAISFDGTETMWSSNIHAIVNAYVTPIPEIGGAFHNATQERGERTWRRVKDAVCSVYEYGAA